MSTLLSLGWRLLLTAALVLNPVLGAASVSASGKAQDEKAAVAGNDETLPPCHQSAHESAPQGEAPKAPDKDHGCGCGNAACQFGMCCAVGALDLVSPLFPALALTGAQAMPLRDFREVDAPPPARMIRPPIA